MLCDKCRQREANVHIQQSVNGVTTERNLCSECASKEPGLMNAFSPESFFGDLFETSLLKRGSGRQGNLFDMNGLTGGNSVTPRDRRNMEFEDVENAALTGIELPKIQMSRENVQEKPAVSGLEDLKTQLKAAIAAENFEKAAELRDKIRKQESDDKEDKTDQ
ncbi:MAG: UvrB/UvrC motif-containing protein [Christensenella sp.]|uniref:UvrB/UvrC motif-containing protein n=1 Tax=Christensenella sp. TaxID=1935934 RepID=UPI002B21C166|nr:UvrB/UvrC motif-containing protein [Christensenella sp.]MEA5002847.1 UvrB/UvrC motif-containing protein [Christensenella sp.]